MMTTLCLSNYTEGFAKYLDKKFSNNDLGITPINGNYSNGFRGHHGPFNLDFEANFMGISKPSRYHQCDFYFEFDFQGKSLLAKHLKYEIGKGTEVNDGKLSKIIDNVRRSYQNAEGRSKRIVLRIDANISLFPNDASGLYGDIWSSLLRIPFLNAMGVSDKPK